MKQVILLVSISVPTTRGLNNKVVADRVQDWLQSAGGTLSPDEPLCDVDWHGVDVFTTNVPSGKLIKKGG